MINTELNLTPTASVNANSIQLCILKVTSFFLEGIYQKSEISPQASFNVEAKTINVTITISNGEQTNLEHFIELNNFPYETAKWQVELDYQDTKKKKIKTKTIQMEINMEPRPTNQFAIQ